MPAAPINTRQSLIYLVARVGTGIILTTATMLVVPRFISPSEMGLVALTLSIYAFLLITCEGGFRLQAIRTDLSKQPLLPGNLLINQTGHVAVALCVLGLLWGIGRVLLPEIWLQSIPLVAAMLLFQPLYFRRQMATVVLERDLNFRAIGRIEIVENIAYNGTLLVGAWSSLGAKSFVLAHIVRCLGSFLQARPLPFMWPKLRGREWLSIEIRHAYRYGFSIQSIQWVHNLRGMITNSLIVSLAGAPALGLYDRSQLVGNAGLGFLQGVSDRFLFAYVSKHFGSDPGRCKETLTRGIRMITWLDKLLHLGILFIGLPLLMHFWGERWSGIKPMVPIVVLGVALFGSLTFPTYPLLSSTGHTRYMLRMAMLALGVTLVAGPVLIGLFGVYGACWLGVILWAMGLLWILKAEEILGRFPWFRSWLLSGATAGLLYVFIRYLMAASRGS